jgi:hypothetical protein
MLVMENSELELVTASLRADSKDIKTYLEILGEKLTASFPGQVRIEKRGLMPGTKSVRRIVVLLGDDRYTLETDNAALTCLHSTMVRGVALKNDQLSLDAWIDELSRSVVRRAEESEQGRLALERLLI